ncbi:MAG TPA: formyltransferase family protein [Dehalococcoidia bacterium]|nr:formyltransferase family protein [Dehalococcoidia bacterium]
MLRIGWFTTARGETSRRLLQMAQAAVASGYLDGRIEVVFCNREPGEDPNTDLFLDLVRSYDIPLVCLSYTRFRRERRLPPVRQGEPLPAWRRDYDREVVRLLEPYAFDVAMLAGYMLVASDVLCSRYPLLNLHPAPPGGPVGVWQEVVWQLIAVGAHRSGAMVHLATPEVDRGPPVAYCLYSLRGPVLDPLWQEVEGKTVPQLRAEAGEELPLFMEIRRRSVARELPLVVEALRAVAQGRVRVEGGRVTDASGNPMFGLDLTPEVEEAVARREAGQPWPWEAPTAGAGR